ncbi:hypothetical protein PIB30_024091 [Stylosanthes scabra]|uniref:Transmembrane protein n=1 Tax=Stylosanthes scabra TaxID=79078 RepID=A0ABU6UCH0_9FABA|nr:hypothetical protein [Stylosanthes scabra]
MDHTISRERDDVEFDLESGGNSTSEDDYSSTGDHCISDDRDSNDDDDDDDDNLELLVEKGSHQFPHLNNNNNNNNDVNKKKASNPRKPSKPPLPPNGPSLIAGDQKFVKELSELALRKRARIKRMKAVRKMKATKSAAASSSSSYSSLSAMIITVFFFLIIIFHGIRSANSDVDGLMASPASEAVTPTEEDLISVQYPKKIITNKGDAPRPTILMCSMKI